MKDWNILTEEELYNLSDEQIEIYKKLLYAQNGIQFPEEPKPIDEINIPKDKTVYKIENLSEVYFGDLSEATGIVEALKKCKALCHTEYARSYTNQYIDNGRPVDYYKNPVNFDINATEFYSKKKMLECQETLETYRRLREQYNKDEEEYNNLQNKAIEVTQEFIERLNNARTTIQHRIKLARKYYLDYLPLANNDSTIAMNFLKKAYSVSDEDVKYIQNHEKEYTDDLNNQA